MPTFTHAPTTIDAVAYVAPEGDGDGNLAELQAFAGPDIEFQRQTPWNPADGQSCLLVFSHGVHFALLRPGYYLTSYVQGDGRVDVVDGEDFAAEYDVTTAQEAPASVPVSLDLSATPPAE